MMNLSQAAQILHAQLTGPDTDFSGISTDTRSLKPGQLYIALRGEKFDGHHFLSQAATLGAVAAVVSQDVDVNIPTIRVANTRHALAELARYHRQQFNMPVIAVTGSCGKTTTRALLASIFSQAGEILASIGSFNNDIGVPITLLQLNSSHQYAIIEMGANHAGEIAFLTHLVRPTVAIITNAAQAHLEGFGDLDGVACAKGEIFQGLSPDGVAIINADDGYADFWRSLAGSRKIITFGINHAADVSASHIQYDSNGRTNFTLQVGKESCQIHLPLIGAHNIYNALAAAAAGRALNLPVAAIQTGLNTAKPEKRRLIEQHTPEGALIIDDSYNANPLSMRAAIELLSRRAGKRILVIGDMRELGEKARQYHQEIGIEAKSAGIEQLFCFGDLTHHAAQAFGKQAYFFADQTQLIQALKPELHQQVTVLVKGSKSMQMDKVVAALCNHVS